jgi:hypothetical protein
MLEVAKNKQTTTKTHQVFKLLSTVVGQGWSGRTDQPETQTWFLTSGSLAAFRMAIRCLMNRSVLLVGHKWKERGMHMA